MRNCRKCGEHVSGWSVGLFSGLCEKCRAEQTPGHPWLGMFLGGLAGLILFIIVGRGVALYLNWVDPIPPPFPASGEWSQGNQRFIFGAFGECLLILCIVFGASVGRRLAEDRSERS